MSDPPLPLRTLLQQRAHRTVWVALGAGGGAVMREVAERAAKCLERWRQLAGERLLNRSGLLPEIIARVAVPEPAADPADARVDRQNGVIGGKEEHPMGTSLAKLGKRLERAARGGERAADDRGQAR